MFTSPVRADDVSHAWLEAVRGLDAIAPKRAALHTMVTIENPIVEDADIRADADRLLKEFELAPIETVANTIFPQQLANASSNHEELVRRYRAIYPELKKRWHPNARGTYFGRLVAYQTAAHPDGYDQLGEIIHRLTLEHARSNGKTAIYEASLREADEPEMEPDEDVADEFAADASALIFTPGRDKLPVGGFPCLSHCSFQLDRDARLHALAHYRSQYLIERGYGNYLGLGRLLAYLCEQTGLGLGTLTVVAGYAQIETKTTKLRPLLARQPSLFN